MNCPINPNFLQPPLRTEEFEALFHLVKIASVCQDLTPLLLYQIDTVQESVLPHLAEQFDVMGYKGWLLADTVEKKRTLIKNAIKLHRKAGTSFAIINSLNAVGIEVSEIIENPPLTYNGRWNYLGTEYYSGKLWDRFIVNFTEDVESSKISLVTALIETWKNERSQYLIRCPELLQFNSVWRYDGVEEYDNCTKENILRRLRYNTIFKYDGVEVYDAYTDVSMPFYLFYNGSWKYNNIEYTEQNG